MIAAARREFEERGYGATTIEAIVEMFTSRPLAGSLYGRPCPLRPIVGVPTRVIPGQLLKAEAKMSPALPTPQSTSR